MVGAADSSQTGPHDVETSDAPEVDEASTVPSTSCDREDASGQTFPSEPQRPSDELVDSVQVGSLIPHTAKQPKSRGDRSKASRTAKLKQRGFREHAADMEVPISMSKTQIRKISDRLMTIRSGQANRDPGVCNSLWNS